VGQAGKPGYPFTRNGVHFHFYFLFYETILQGASQQCMLPDPHDRPTFDGLVEILEPLRKDVNRANFDLRASFEQQ